MIEDAYSQDAYSADIETEVVSQLATLVPIVWCGVLTVLTPMSGGCAKTRVAKV